jgi:hypothetical protein
MQLCVYESAGVCGHPRGALGPVTMSGRCRPFTCRSTLRARTFAPLPSVLLLLPEYFAITQRHPLVD